MARHEPELTPELILRAYAAGIFPMSEARNDAELFWVDPKLRGIMPLDGFHISRTLRRRLLAKTFTVTFDQAFDEVVQGCADRDETWISRRIEALYGSLFAMGQAHSAEVWEGAHLVGGIYGVSLGGAFFGESMFSRRTDASKVGLAFLVDRLLCGGFRLFDAQFLTDHLASLGAVEIARAEYHQMLEDALEATGNFHRQGPAADAQDVVQRNSQTS